MAIFRCHKCGHLREVANDYIGKSVKCPKCKQKAPIHDTVPYIQNVIKKYFRDYKELRKLRRQLIVTDESEHLPDEQDDFEEIDDIYNTTALTQHHQYEPIIKWFGQRQIQVEENTKAIDTTGFFDEVALTLGNGYEILQMVSNQIKYVQQKGYTNVKLTISKKNQKQIKAITAFCQELYEYSFVARYFYHKRNKIIRLNLQTAFAIKNFFNGEWLEWFVFMKLLEYFREKQISYSCLRNLLVTFPNEDSNELDVFFLVNNRIPVCIECKSGEFRQHIGKYSKLRKRLNLDKTQFLLCVVGLGQKQTQGLTSMYDLTFVNENNFIQYVERLL